jgi:signal transduction histidine kinase
MGGTITVESELNMGTCFIIKIPTFYLLEDHN